MNSGEIAELLMTLRSEAIALTAAPSIAREAVDNWRARTRAILVDAYGDNSPPVRDFSRIRFEDVSVADVADRVLREWATQEGLDLGEARIRLPPAEASLRQGLHQAAELLLSLAI
jgi:hypothetical protein